MRHQATIAFCTLGLAAALMLSPDAGLARDRGAKPNVGNSAAESTVQTTTVPKARKRPPRAYSGKDPQPAARSQDR